VNSAIRDDFAIDLGAELNFSRLTARVAVNGFWQAYQSIVQSA
jgi:hypothetical protein